MLKAVFCVFAAAQLIVSQGQIPPGGKHPVDPSDPRLAPAIELAFATVNADCDCKMCQTVLNVTNATSQFLCRACPVG